MEDDRGIEIAVIEQAGAPVTEREARILGALGMMPDSFEISGIDDATVEVERTLAPSMGYNPAAPRSGVDITARD